MAGKSFLKVVHDKGFAQGVAVACAIMVGAFGQETEAREILCAVSLDTVQKMKAREIDEYDLNILRPVLAQIRRHGRSTRSRYQHLDDTEASMLIRLLPNGARD